MPSASALYPYQATVAPDVLLDGRLALFHQTKLWLVVADLHFGYEISQRAAGRLVPMWGMTTIEERLRALIADYEPQRLIIAGDVVHDRAAAGEARELICRLREICEVVVLAGNHDRALASIDGIAAEWREDDFVFHHGHCEPAHNREIQIIGHHHPTGTVHDGAGLRLKLPAFVQEGRCWILPAFSPWAAGAAWRATEQSRVWLCTPQRILQLPAAT